MPMSVSVPISVGTDTGTDMGMNTDIDFHVNAHEYEQKNINTDMATNRDTYMNIGNRLSWKYFKEKLLQSDSETLVRHNFLRYRI
jgi:hypothetical protein